MESITGALGPLFLLILLGVLLGNRHWPSSEFWVQMERLIYFVLFPAMLVGTLATADVSQVPVGRLALVLLGAMALFGMALWHFRGWLALEPAAFTSVFQGAVRFNTYVGVAGAAALHGSLGATTAAVAVALMVPIVNVMCVASFVAAGTLGSASVGKSALALIKNPLILGCLLGIALNVSGIGLPGWSEDTVSLLGGRCLAAGTGGCRGGAAPACVAALRPRCAGHQYHQAGIDACIGAGVGLGVEAGPRQPRRGAALCGAAHGYIGLYLGATAGRRCRAHGGDHHWTDAIGDADAADVAAMGGGIKINKNH